jgi:hypothetical protein
MLGELKDVERLLLTPDRAAMDSCERKLDLLVLRISQTGVPASERTHVKNLLRNIRFLLDRANAFWQARQRATAPALQYSLGGRLTSPGVISSVNVEV